MKHLIVALVTCLGFAACKQSPQTQTAEIKFETMGTFGTVKIVSDSLEINQEKIAKDIDSILVDVNNEFSTYISSSTISRLNSIPEYGDVLIGDLKELEMFCEVYMAGYNYFVKTEGYFDYKIKPLVDYYYSVINSGLLIDSAKVDSISKYTSQLYTLNCDRGDSHTGSTISIGKTGPMTLDFSAFAKGYGVDVVAEYLSNLGYTNYMVEIGGEVVCKGLNASAEVWRLGIEEPNEDVRAIYEVVAIKDKAMATSGNYRNFKVLENGQKVVHIINPKTVYPEISNLLSASIVTDDCMSADAYATACMVMGVDTCFDFVLNHPELECYLIYSDEAGELQVKYTEEFGEMIVE